MKVAFVFPPMWPADGDGALQIWNREITQRLSKSCNVLVYSGLHSSQTDEENDGILYRRFPTHFDTFVKNSYYRLLKVFPFIRDVVGVRHPLFSSDLWYLIYALRVALNLRTQDCDVVHVHYYPQFAYLIKRLNPECRVVLHMHGEWLTQVKFRKLHFRLGKLDAIISCSNFCTNLIRQTFPEIAGRCTTVPMGLSPEAFSGDGHNVHRSEANSKRLLFIGRISPEKGLHVLLDAFERMLREYPNASLAIVGPESVAARDTIVDLCLDKSLADGLAPFYRGSYLAQLRQRLSPAAAERVTFVGSATHSDIPKYCADADIYISPSFYESFGMAIIEAMAAGIPVVAARGGAVPDLVADGRTGLLVNVADPQAIADAVAQLFENSGLRTSVASAARKMVCDEFSWETILAALVQTYDKALGDKSIAKMQLGSHSSLFVKTSETIPPNI